MSKQDGYSPRTAADLERKYNFGQSFAEVYGLANDARKAAEDAELAAEEAKKELAGLDAEEIFLKLTKGDWEQGVFRAANGKLYINAEYIDSGHLSADRIEAGTITGEKIASNTIETSHLNANVIEALALKIGVPEALSDLDNDMDFQDTDGVTTIIGGYLETDGIKADWITSGTISADSVEVDGLLTVKSYNKIWGWASGYIGCQPSTGSIAVTSSDESSGLFVSDNSAMIVFDNGSVNIGVDLDGCFASDDIHVTSDRTMKNSISYAMDAEEALFLKLRPCSFVYNKDESKKKHWGFIAQDLQESAEEVGMETDNLAVLGRHNDKLSLGYSEITPLNTLMIQKLIARVAALEEKLA